MCKGGNREIRVFIFFKVLIVIGLAAIIYIVLSMQMAHIYYTVGAISLYDHLNKSDLKVKVHHISSSSVGTLCSKHTVQRQKRLSSVLRLDRGA